jgi:hypothetical protein
MAFLWTHNAHIAFSQLAKAGVTIALIKAFVRFSTTAVALNIPSPTESYLFVQ